MQISFTPAARSFVKDGGDTVTISSLVFSSCCSGPLAPTVAPGPPGDADGFYRHQAGDVVVFYDSLLDERPQIAIDLKDYGTYQELFIQGWE